MAKRERPVVREEQHHVADARAASARAAPSSSVVRAEADDRLHLAGGDALERSCTEPTLAIPRDGTGAGAVGVLIGVAEDLVVAPGALAVR